MNNTPEIDTTVDVEKLSYEAARDLLVGVVRQLEGNQLPLARSMELWEFGEKLTTHCRAALNSAKAKVDAAGAEEN